ncbi:DMT family transporter [Kitasatospora sp. NPDC002227]|uniref:DMT family transporter n=1 Tax=Kitasatospora sp. NPDC002227 TaxID=3154773 RepID=UPI003331AA01
MRSQTTRDLPLLAVAVVWGSSFLVLKQVATQETAIGTLVLRFGISVPLLALFAWRGLRTLRWREWAGGASLGLILAAIFLMETYGAIHTSATNAGLIVSLTMVFTPLAESAVRRTALPKAFLGAAFMSVVGVALLTGGGFQAPKSGDLLILGSALIRTVHVLAMSRAKWIKGTDALSLTWLQLGTAAVVFALVSPFVGASPLAVARSYGAAEWAGLLYLALLCTLFAFLVQMWAVRATSPSRVSLLLGTEPLWAALFGTALGGDRLSILALFGGVLVLAGTEWGRRASAPPAPAPAVPEREPELV